MKRTLYIIALLLSIVTAIGYTIGKGWEEENLKQSQRISAEEELDQTRRDALSGDVEAQYRYGVYFDALKADYGNALKWYLVAAKRGNHAGAMYKLGQLYRSGLSVENDMAEAMRWYRAGADGGDARAQFFLAIALRDGWEGRPDLIEAYKWFLLASEQREQVRAEDPRYDPYAAEVELARKISDFDKNEAQKRAENWKAVAQKR